MNQQERAMTTCMERIARLFLLRLACSAAVVIACTVVACAGGPRNVAGSSYFNSSANGQPLVWAQGVVNYYTDQGDLSPILPNASANAFVANAFSQWTAAPTAALSASNAGQLAEDVNGTNVTVNSDGSISMPADIQPTATATPVGIVYDYDGTVTDALLGAGAGGSTECFFNAVFGGTDNYGTLATYQHALIVIDGQCAQQSSQLNDVEYRLVRVIGSVLGVGWSQVNLNVQTDSPPPTSDDFAGFPVMHYTDSWTCVPITICYASPYQLSMDDVASLSRLYPVTAENQSSFPGKQIFSSVTARVSGSVWFTGSLGNSTQGMQGVNVVARWINPATGQPSRRYAAASVSGFLFSGNQGNPITGPDDIFGDPLSEWGSNTQALEGFFDLAGLELPNGGTAQYQLTVENLDPYWSAEVGPYAPGPVSLSGTSQPVTVTISPGSDVEQDILMTGAAQPLPQPASNWANPAAIPNGGDWISSLSAYGETAYFLLPAQANRTLSVAVTALDATGNSSEVKIQPVIGIWNATDPAGTLPSAFTPSPFNELSVGMTRLDAQFFTPGNFIIGVSDVRGDGRPDYVYHAHVLYADSVTPARIGVTGGPITVQGTGFFPGLGASVGNTSATQLSVSASQMIVAAPAHSDGPQNISITDPVSGSSTVMTGALTYGAAATDNLILLYGLNPSTPVGAQAAKPVSVRVVAADGVTPITGATVGWNATNGLQLSACGGTSSCSTTTDQSGDAVTWLTPGATGTATLTATLAPGVYSPPKTVSTSIYATESSSDIGTSTPYLWVSQGATATLTLTARVLANGVPQNAAGVNFAVVTGSGSLSTSTAQTNSSGYASVVLTVTQISSLVQVSACVVPANTPCGVFYVNAVPLALQNLQQISGAGQTSAGQTLQPIVVRVIDSSSPPNSVIAAPVEFLATLSRPGGDPPGAGSGETNPGNPSMPVILSVSQTNATTDGNGLASFTPATSGFSPPLIVDVAISAGTAALLDDPLQLLPAIPTGNSPGEVHAPFAQNHPIRATSGKSQPGPAAP